MRAAAAVVEYFISQIECCIATRDLALGHLVHARIHLSALARHTLLGNRLVDMYSKCGDLPSAVATFTNLPTKNHQSYNALLAAYARHGFLELALNLFDKMPLRNLVSYNTMISNFTRHNQHYQSLCLFKLMKEDSNLEIVMDKFTVVGVVSACAGLEDLRALRQVHATVIVYRLELNIIMFNVLVDAYGKCGDSDASQCLFDSMELKDIVSWTSLISAYTNCDRLDAAREIFNRVPDRNAVCWTALISGHEQNGQNEKAMELFAQMVGQGYNPTELTLVSVLSACASLGLVNSGKQIHGYIMRRVIGITYFNIFVHNALIDMYSKCGDMRLAVLLFDKMRKRDFVSWNSLVTGFAQNGLGKISLEMFKKMVDEGIKPTDVTFLAVLSACSHTGLVSEGHRLLKMMKEYGLSPRSEHYAAFADSLGRKGLLKEAMEFLEDFASDGEPGIVGAWGALLGACRVHGNLELAKRAAEKLFVLDPDNGARYVALSNVYSAAGQWDDARKIRALMRGKGLRKDAGCSWIEFRNRKHMFVAEDKSHDECEEIYRMLETVLDVMKRRMPDFLDDDSEILLESL